MADQVVQDIKDRLNIVELIGSFIPVKKSGTNYKAVCPFHNEKTASLMISPQKQIWHCFGCGEGGDIFGFVMRYENLDFKEALQILADKAGVQLPTFRPEAPGSRDVNKELVRINNFAAAAYHKVLLQPTGHSTLDYLQSRGLNDNTIKHWQIGFAPDEFHFLENALAKKQVRVDALLQAGVSVRNDNGQVYDRFRNRITFPIYNYYGDVVGFSARALPGDDASAKYINSPETAIYNKSKILFGLNFAKEAIRKKNEAVVVEGQMDTISAHQAGFQNTVASSGTALTEQQLRMLGRLTHVLKFCFDADSAGGTATRRAGELALQQGFQVKVIVLKQVKDPDELIKQSPGLWQKAVNEAVWFVDFYLNRAAADFSEGSVEQKHYLSQEVMPLLSFIVDPLEQDHYVRQLSDRFRISERVVRDTINQQKRVVAGLPQSQGAGQGARGPTVRALPSINPLEKQILGALLQFPEFLSLVQVEGLPLEGLNPVLQPFYAAALSGQTVDATVNEDPLAKEAIFMVESELDQFDNNEASFLRELEKNFYLLKLNFVKRQLADLTRSIGQAEMSNDSLRLDELNRQFAELTATRLELENKL